MAIFSTADEKEIEKRKQDQDRREVDLDRRKADLDYREKKNAESVEDLTKQRGVDSGVLKTSQEELTAREQALFAREQEVSRREIAAAAGSVEKQREAFRDVIDVQIKAFNLRKEELKALEERLAKELEVNILKEGELSTRETVVLERELKADAGFADKARVLREEIEAREDACIQREEKIRGLEDDLKAERGSIETRSEALRKREEILVKSEQERDGEYTDLRRQLDQELQQKRLAVEEEITRTRSERLSVMEAEFGTFKKQRLEEVARAESAERERAKIEIASAHARLDEETQHSHDKLKTAREELERAQAKLDDTRYEVAFRETMVNSKEDALNRRYAAIEEETSTRVAERRQSFESSENILKEENARLRKSLAATEALLGCFDELKRRLGDEPEKVLTDLNAKTDELKTLREELASRPTQEMRERFDSQQTELERLRANLSEMEAVASEHRQRLAGENELRAKLGESETSNKALLSQVETLDAACNRLQTELKSKNAAYEREEEIEKRTQHIKKAYLDGTPSFRKEQGEFDEIEWLKTIETSCINYGLRFNPRLLRAFHTALKTAEWSPMTILAGVSGTGKSELPRLYAHFGGMPFLPLSVQPNWDSQESMLGFFNSIDNKFDAQPVLRFLAQSQGKNADGYPGLLDAVCIILLDEMNLAHAELYFAEFLSKLELRRGLKGDQVPCLDVKLGAGLEPYKLPLGRNVLWTGTMNQDETTKSLSDKVLDRSIVIHFPRPMKLERRKKLNPLPAAAPLLPRKVWEGWWSKDSEFSDADVQPFKEFIEEMNVALSQAGRALGHRVWQSIEYYMTNYPDVRAARKSKDTQELKKGMRMAFEDQLVQKVMPKLRGIETRGRSKSECLDKIRAQIVAHDYQIIEDFDLACEFGYGQFMWQSANYLRDTEPSTPEKPDSGNGDQSATDIAQNPSKSPGDSITVSERPESTDPKQQKTRVGRPPRQKTTVTEPKPDLREGVYYSIISKASKKCLDAPAGQNFNGSKIQQWAFGGGKNQLWKLRRVDDFFAIISADTGKCLDVEGASTENGAAIVQWDLSSQDNQIWEITRENDGCYTIKSRSSDKFLSTPDPVYDGDGGPIQQWASHQGPNQRWFFEERSA